MKYLLQPATVSWECWAPRVEIWDIGLRCGPCCPSSRAGGCKYERLHLALGCGWFVFKAVTLSAWQPYFMLS